SAGQSAVGASKRRNAPSSSSTGGGGGAIGNPGRPMSIRRLPASDGISRESRATSDCNSASKCPPAGPGVNTRWKQTANATGGGGGARGGTWGGDCAPTVTCGGDCAPTTQACANPNG